MQKLAKATWIGREIFRKRWGEMHAPERESSGPEAFVKGHG